jgi:cysteine synthase
LWFQHYQQEPLMIYSSMIDMIGNTPYVQYKTNEIKDARIFVKLESWNPTGSIKDRAAIYNIKDAIQSGKLTPGKTILDASSGNMACALAYFGKLLGYRVKVVCNSKLTQDKKQFIEYFGASLSVHGDLTIEGNRLCREWAESPEGKDEYCFLDQLHNMANPRAAYETLGPEILRDFPQVAAVVGSMGSGGSMCGTSRYIKEKKKDTYIVTSQAAHGTKIPGTGAFVDGDYITPFIIELRETPLYDETISIHLAEAEKRTKELAAQGIFVGIQGGGVLHAAIDAINRNHIKGDVVMVIGDSGWKNMDKLKALI